MGPICEALRPISVLNSQLSIYSHRLKIILLTPRSKRRHAHENYNHNSYGNLFGSLRLQRECKGCHSNCLSRVWITLSHFKEYRKKYFKFFIARNVCHQESAYLPFFLLFSRPVCPVISFFRLASSWTKARASVQWADADEGMRPKTQHPSPWPAASR